MNTFKCTQAYLEAEKIKETILQIIYKYNRDKYEEAKNILNPLFILRNNSYTKICPMFLKQLTRLQSKIDTNELEYLNLLEHSNCEYKYFNSDTVYKSRLCKSDVCRYAHSEEELRVPLCILHFFDCCKKCTYDHTSINNTKLLTFDKKEEIETVLPHIILYTKQYKNEDGKEIFKIFYYTDCVRIYYYSTNITSVMHLKDEDKETIFETIVKNLNNN